MMLPPRLGSLLALLLCLASLGSASAGTEGRAAIVEMNDFPEPYGDIPVDFINTARLVDALNALGWENSSIRVHNNVTERTDVARLLDWLENATDADDIALLYVFTHGSWMSKVLNWNEWFPQRWISINCSAKLLIVDTCGSGGYISALADPPEGHVSLSGCAPGEVEWAGLEEEGLPILGSVWNYYFTTGLLNSTADTDGDSYVSVEEAHNWSVVQTQTYMREEVYSRQEFLELYHEEEIYPEQTDGYPNPVIHDAYDGKMILDMRYHAPEGPWPYPLSLLVLAVIISLYRSKLSADSKYPLDIEV